MKKYKDIEFTLHAIIAGVLMNGWIQGKDNKNVDTSVIAEALQQIKKLLTDKAL